MEMTMIKKKRNHRIIELAGGLRRAFECIGIPLKGVLKC